MRFCKHAVQYPKRVNRLESMFRSFKFFSILGLEHSCFKLSPEAWKPY